MKKQSDMQKLFSYAGKYKILTISSWILSAASALTALLPFVYIWKIIKEVLDVCPNFSEMQNVGHNGWMAVLFSAISVLIYMGALTCSHLAAFRVQANIRSQAMHHIVTLPMGFMDGIGSGKIRKIVDESSVATETYLAHQLPDKAGALATPVGLLVLLLAFDWRLGLLSLIPIVIAFLLMSLMTGKRMAQKMKEYNNALGQMSNEAVEYVRGISVVKTFGQSVFSFKRFKASIDNYEKWVVSYTKDLRTPMMFYTTLINAIFAILIAASLVMTKDTYKESGVRRITLAEKLRRLPLSFFGKKDLSDLTSVLMADCASLEGACSHWIPEFAGSIVSTIIIAVSLFFFDWRMALASLWVLPISFGIVLSSTNVMRKLQEKQTKINLACTDGIQECLETVRDLKANNAEENYLIGLDKKIKTVEKHTVIGELTNAIFHTSARVLLKFGIATTALVGGMLLAKGSLTLLTYFMFLIVVSRLYDPLTGAMNNLSAILLIKHVQSKRMDEILSHSEQQGSEALTNKGCDIVFDHVGFSYNKNEQVLRDVSFTAKQGEVTALIGPSGGGKTTISRLAARFWDVSKGSITVGGMDVSTIEPETLMSLYSIVFQDVTLFNNTIMENIRIGRKNASDQEVLAAAKLAHCDEFAEKMPQKWNTMIGENGSELSGGERQRISIARAFLKDAPIILLDEATASLDVENETMIQESLSQLIQNKTVMIIAHRMRTVSGADKIVVLKDGVVAQQGAPDELSKENGIYSHMVTLQQKSSNWKMA